MYSIFVVLCLVNTAFAWTRSFGFCPFLDTEPDFDISKYLGTWYEAESYNYDLDELTKCNRVDVSRIISDTYEYYKFRIRTTGFSKETGELVERAGFLDQSRPKKLGGLTFNRGISHKDRFYFILGTDYNSFAVVYFCDQWILNYYLSIFILTRERNPDASVIDKAYAIMAKHDFGHSNGFKVDQTNCEA